MRPFHSPKVSVIIPVFNASRYLRECIDSVLSQSYRNIEIVVVNDGSTDDSFLIAQSYGDKIVLLNQPNQGAAAARNNGILHATGDYFQFLDADDVLDADKIKCQVDHLQMVGASAMDLAFGRWTILGKYVWQMPNNQTSIWHDYEEPKEILLDFSLNDCCMPHLSYLTSRQLIEEVGLWNKDLSLNDDGEFFARVIGASRHIHYCEDALSMYRSTPNSLSKRMSKRAAASQMNSVVKTAEIMAMIDSVRKDDAIKKFISASLCKLFPYYHKERKIGEAFLTAHYPSYQVQYPHLLWKERIYYVINCLKHYKELY